MTDGTRWTPPDAGPSGPAPTPWSAPTPPLGAPPASGGPTPPPFAPASGPVPLGGGTGWTPPPKPGLVPLRPMTLGTILGAMFQVMRRNPLPTFGFAILLSLVSSVITVGLLALAFVPVAGSGVDGPSAPALLGTVALAIVGGVVGVVAQLLVLSIVQGVVTLEVASGTLGERMRLAGLWRRLRPRLPRVIGWLALVSVASGVAFGLLIAIVVGIATLGDSAAGGAVAVAVLGSLGLGVLGIWIGFKLVFVVPSIVLERRGVFASIARSWRLTSGYFWRTFGIVLLVYVIYGVAGSIISWPIQVIVALGASLFGLGSDESSSIGLVVAIYGVSIVLGWLIGAVGMVMLSATVALLHIDTRMRKEGLDQDLIRAAEARAAGASFRDPYTDEAPAAPPDSPWA